jgi:hypothetical protein
MPEWQYALKINYKILSYIPEGNVFHNYVTSVLATKLYQLSSSTYPDKPY